MPLTRERVETERLVAPRANRLRTNSADGTDHDAVSLTDPEGNEFDIF